MVSLFAHRIKDTHFIGHSLGELIDQPMFLAIDGDLGAGKTSFVQGLAKGLGVEVVPRSPTFAIMEEYEGRIPLLHVDFYRLEEEDLMPLGLEEQLEEWDGVVAVEWASRFPFVFPTEALFVHIAHVGESMRRLDISYREDHLIIPRLKEICAFLL
jgi:tRNA threonylcarbamoyladenosine biosynthesis protein TsaE